MSRMPSLLIGRSFCAAASRTGRLGSRHFSSVGEVGRATRTWTSADVAAFAELTHDSNPLHSNEDFTAAARFGKPVVHGMLYASMFSAIVGQSCPGAVYVSQSLNFRKPVYIGDTVTAEIEVQRVAGGGRLLDFATRCSNQEAELVLEGAARVLLPRRIHPAETSTDLTEDSRYR